MYSELCREPPPPTALAGIPTLLVHAEHFGLVRAEQLDEYPAALGDGLELVGVPGGHVVYWDAFDETATRSRSSSIRHIPFHTRESIVVRLTAGGNTTRGPPGARFSRES